MSVAVKICGLSTRETTDAALDFGARWIGLVFVPRSSRFVGLDQAAALAARARGRAGIVALLVDPEADQIAAVLDRVPVDLLQLHGAETPARVAEIRARFKVPVIKAVGVSEAPDLDQAAAYEPVADWLLFDAKPPKRSGALPGGNGAAFDWRLMAGRTWARPWMLSGGLDPTNVGRAIALTGASAVDVSSGVETAPGQKDAALIGSFIRAVEEEREVLSEGQF